MTNATSRRPFWRQPLVHFLAAGIAIFLLDTIRGGGSPSPADDKIIVTVAQVERMAELWTRTWGRPPSEAELQGLVRDHIKEEIYYREALKLGLDVNDTVIRRRLRQKMEFLSEGDADIAEPDEDTLQAYFQDTAERYQEGETFNFRQVYFSDNNPEKAQAVLETIQNGAPADQFSDAIGLPEEMAEADKRAITRVFGSMFYDNFAALPLGQWAGPVQSSFGLHLVNIIERSESQPASLADIRKRVIADWRSDETLRRRNEAFEALRTDYDIEIEQPE